MEIIKENWLTISEISQRFKISESIIINRVKKELKKGNPNVKKSFACRNNFQFLVLEKEVERILILSGFIYLLKSKNLYKVGITQNPKKRIGQYTTANPFGIKLIFQQEVKNCFNLERKLCMQFQNKQIRGEWFKLSNDDIIKAKQLVGVK